MQSNKDDLSLVEIIGPCFMFRALKPNRYSETVRKIFESRRFYVPDVSMQVESDEVEFTDCILTGVHNN